MNFTGSLQTSAETLSEHLKETGNKCDNGPILVYDSCNALNIAYQKRVNPYFLFWTNYKIGD